MSFTWHLPGTGEDHRKRADLVLQHILASFPSQAGRRWFEEDVYLALFRLRGLECNSPSRHAEAFYGRKVRLTSSA